jgi:hypothetical protein
LLIDAVFLAFKRLRLLGHISVSLGCWGLEWVSGGDFEGTKNLGQGFSFTKTFSSSGLLRVGYFKTRLGQEQLFS